MGITEVDDSRGFRGLQSTILSNFPKCTHEIRKNLVCGRQTPEEPPKSANAAINQNIVWDVTAVLYWAGGRDSLFVALVNSHYSE